MKTYLGWIPYSVWKYIEKWFGILIKTQNIQCLEERTTIISNFLYEYTIFAIDLIQFPIFYCWGFYELTYQKNRNRFRSSFSDVFFSLCSSYSQNGFSIPLNFLRQLPIFIVLWFWFYIRKTPIMSLNIFTKVLNEQGSRDQICKFSSLLLLLSHYQIHINVKNV